MMFRLLFSLCVYMSTGLCKCLHTCLHRLVGPFEAMKELLEQWLGPDSGVAMRQCDSGHNYIGHNYIDHNYIGQQYIGHNYIDHNYFGHDCIGHN